MRVSTRLLSLGLLATAALAGGVAAYDVFRQGDGTDPDRPIVPGSGALDGLRFSGQVGPLGKPGDVNDSFVFAEGLFNVLCNPFP